MGRCLGQTTYLSNVQKENELTLFSQVQEDNGAFLSPDNQRLVITSRNAVFVLDPATFTVLQTFEFTTLSTGAVLICKGGVHFSWGSSTRYFTFMVTENEGTATATTQVVGLSLDGDLLFVSERLPGEGAGTPVASSDGSFIVLTHNVQQQVGHFSVLELDVTSYNATTLAFTGNDALAPFSQVGYVHNPSGGGLYEGGQSNFFDFFVFCYDVVVIPGVDPTVDPGGGQIFVMQPPNYAFQPVGNPENFITHNPPILTQDGQRLYWAVSKGDNFAWVNRGLNNPETARAAFGRGSPPYIPARAPHTLSSSVEQPIVYGPGANALIWRMDALFTESINKTTTDVVIPRIIITPDDLYLFYATQDGSVVCADAATLQDVWIAVEGDSFFRGEMAYDASRGILYVPSDTGVLFLYRVATVQTGPTNPPTLPPTVGATAVPTMMRATLMPSTPLEEPTVAASVTPTLADSTEVPSLSPTIPPFMGQSAAPTAEATTKVPSAGPIAERTLEPTPEASELNQGGGDDGRGDESGNNSQPTPEPTRNNGSAATATIDISLQPWMMFTTLLGVVGATLFV